MLNTKSFFEEIELHFNKALPFVLYRKPDTNTVFATIQTSDKLFTTTIFKEKGFVFAPFDTKSPAILLKQDVILKTSDEYFFTKKETFKNEIEDPMVKEQYLKLVLKAITSIKEGNAQKIVLSRVEEINAPNIDIFHLFKRLCGLYKSAFTYLWYHPKVGLWLGATPEMLLKKGQSEITTMSLAGTQLYKKTLDVKWGEKEKEEQQIVTDSIVSSLSEVLSKNNIKVSSPFTKRAGHLLHLCTSITATPEIFDLKQYINALHPTPAICGFPKKEAKKFILESEPHNRAYYTGFMGIINNDNIPDENTELYVNLRCMEIKDDKVLIYIGGGITSASVPELEWEETCNKANVMKEVIFDVQE